MRSAEAPHTRDHRLKPDAVEKGARRADPARLGPRQLFIGHIREVERFAAVRERDPGIAQACKVLPLVIIVRFFGQSRHSSGRFPSCVALLHVVGSLFFSSTAYYTPAGSRRTP